MIFDEATGAAILTGTLPEAADEETMKNTVENTMKKTFTILHTNDMHSSFIGMSPAVNYTPFTLNDDKTRGGYARLAALIAQRKAVRATQGPVKKKGELPIIPVDGRANEVRAIEKGESQ